MIAAIEVSPPVEGREYRVWRHGHRVDIDPFFNADGDIIGFVDVNLLNLPVVHYSIQPGTQGETLPRVYCGSVRPVLGSCSVSLVDGTAMVDFDGRHAEYVWRNGARVQSPFGGDERLLPGAMSFTDIDARYIGQRSHYSAEWADGSRSYCGVVTVPGAPFTCDLAQYWEGSPYVRIRPNFGEAAAPGRAVVYRDGQIVPTISFADETNGRLDPNFTPGVAHQYSLGWTNQQGELLDRVDCGYVTANL